MQTQSYGRAQFVAFGILPVLNVLALLLYGLSLATSSTGGAERSLPALIGIVALCLVVPTIAAIRRGRSLGWPWWVTVLAIWLSLGLGPLVLVPIGYLTLATPKPGVETEGEQAAPAGALTWIACVWAVLNLLWPWLVLAVLARTL